MLYVLQVDELKALELGLLWCDFGFWDRLRGNLRLRLRLMLWYHLYRRWGKRRRRILRRSRKLW